MFYVIQNKENSSEKMASRACFFAVTRATISLLNLAFSLDRLTINTILGFIVAFPLRSGFQNTLS